MGRTDSTVSKSLLSLLTRLMGDGTTTKVVWLVLAAAVTVLAFWWARRSYQRGDLMGATLMVGTLSVAVSPISWPHHQLWLVLVACWWALQQGWGSRLLALLLFRHLVLLPSHR